MFHVLPAAGTALHRKKAGASSLTLWWEQGFPSSSQTTLCISGWCRIWSMLSHLFWQFTFLIHSCQLLHSKPHQLDPIKSPSFPTCKIKQLSCLRAWFCATRRFYCHIFDEHSSYFGHKGLSFGYDVLKNGMWRTIRCVIGCRTCFY